MNTRVTTSFRNIIRRTGLRRTHLAAARMCCERNALASFGRTRDRTVGRILCYHSVGQPLWGINDVSPAQLRRHIEICLNGGMRFVYASELARTGGGPGDLAITFDDGLRSVATHAAPILREYGIPWSLFAVSDWSELRGPWTTDVVLGWRDIEGLVAAGAELGSHSVTHPDFGLIDEAQIVDELGQSRQMIESRIGVKVDSFAIPLGQSMNWSLVAGRAAHREGYGIVYAQAEETRPLGTVARTFVTRFDGERIFRSLLAGAFDRWQEWV
jgi:peptidoglycan/xylan/chitin deacetylase (PgdA/CDA1 family)